MDKLYEYIASSVNLYGMLPLGKVVEIYNRQNKEKITLKKVKSCRQNILNGRFVYVYKKHFVHEAILVFNDFKGLMKKKKGKPYYVPEKEVLLKYADPMYYEKPVQFYELSDYIKGEIFPEDNEKADELCENIMGECREGKDLQNIFQILVCFGLDLKNDIRVNGLMNLVYELSDNIRRWENNGYTNREIRELGSG